MKAVTIDPNADLPEWASYFHAQPGPEYLVCQITEQMQAAEEGWTPLPGAPYARVLGRDCLLMFRGEVVPGANVGTLIPRFHLDPKLYDFCFPQEKTGGAAAKSGK